MANPYGVTPFERASSAIKKKRDAFAESREQVVRAQQPLPNVAMPVTQPFTPIAKPQALLPGTGIPAIASVAKPVSAPAATPAVDPAAPVSVAGAPAPVGRVPAPSSGLSSGIGPNGLPNYDNSSIAKLQARTAQPAVAAPSITPPAPVAAMPSLSVNVPRPQVADAYGSRQASEARMKAVSDIDSQIFAAGISGFNSRGKRQMLGDLLGAKAGLVEGGARVAADIAGGDRNAAAATDLAVLDESGQNQRSLLDSATTRDVSALREQGETRRQRIQEIGATQRALIPRPERITDAKGNVLEVTGTKAAAVLDAEGNPVRAAGTTDTVTPKDKLKFLVDQQALLQESLVAADKDQKPRIAAEIDVIRQEQNKILSPPAVALGAPANQQDYLAKARAANPGVSDAEHIKRYTEKYGQAK